MLEHLDIYLDQYYCLVLIFGRIRNQDDVVHPESYFNFSDLRAGYLESILDT